MTNIIYRVLRDAFKMALHTHTHTAIVIGYNDDMDFCSVEFVSYLILQEKTIQKERKKERN